MLTEVELLSRYLFGPPPHLLLALVQGMAKSAYREYGGGFGEVGGGLRTTSTWLSLLPLPLPSKDSSKLTTQELLLPGDIQ